MNIRLANLDDAPALAWVGVDTWRTAHRAQIPDEAFPKSSLAEAYAESERNWLQALHEMADNTNPQERIFVATDETGAVVGLIMGGPPKVEILPNSGEVYTLYVLQVTSGAGLARHLYRRWWRTWYKWACLRS